MTYPKNFLWGAATSSHQVEGNLTNSWSTWEKRVANDLAKKSVEYSHLPIWEDIADAATSKENYISGAAANHAELFEEDIKLMKEIGLNSYRLSLEWARVEPTKAEYSEEGIAFYKKLIAALKKNNIEPLVTLYHWTLPVWAVELGEWKSREVVDRFVQYAEKIVSELHKDVTYWMTINEPDVYASNSFLAGNWPPQGRNFFNYLRMYRGLIRAHKAVFKKMRLIAPNAKVGIAKNTIYFEAVGNTLWNRLLKWGADWWWNYRFLNATEGYHDFVGVNFYFHHRIKGWFKKNENKRISDLGWELYPQGIYNVIKLQYKKYGLPVVITENGLADMHDAQREWFISETMQALERCQKEDIALMGYMHWSLLDNFEWDKGFWPRFGLIEVDFETHKRTIRPSARKYGEYIKKQLG